MGWCQRLQECGEPTGLPRFEHVSAPVPLSPQASPASASSYCSWNGRTGSVDFWGGDSNDQTTQEVSMIATCANPTCNREFRELSKGRLFLLPPNRSASSDSMGEVLKLIDYCYWLCPECDTTHTISRVESQVVVNARGPGNPYPGATSPGRSKRPQPVTLRSYTQAG